jgi:oligopeptide transport system substrate-binding protein
MTRLLVIPLGLLLLLAGAVVWSGSGAQQRAEFRFINRGDIFTLDINQMSYLQDFRLTYAIREGLYNLDPETYVPVPAGATSYDLSDDKRVWTFHLRPEAKWSNGDPVRAADYEWSWRRMLEEPGEYTYLFYYIKNSEAYERSYAKDEPIDFASVGMKAVDDLTFRVTLENPVPYLLDLVAFPPFYPRNEKSMQPFKETVPGSKNKYTFRTEYTKPPDVVTNGPFSLKVWDFHRRLILERSEQYWDRANVKSKSIEMVANDNVLSQFLLYEAGDVDWLADIPGELAAELKDKGRKDLRSSPAFGTCFLTFLCQSTLPPSTTAGETGVKNPLADIRVRQALAMAIDKRFIVNTITRMGELPARTYLPPDGTLREFTWLPGPYSHKKEGRIGAEDFRKLLMAEGGLEGDGPGVPTNLARAKQLLAEAGYPEGRGMPQMPVLYITSNPTRAKIAQVLKSQWKTNLGVDVSVQGVEGKIFSQRCTKKDYAIGIAAWYGDYPDASTFTDKYKSTSLQNDCDWIRPEFDDLCAQATREPDSDKRMRLLERAENMIDSEVPIVPLYHYVNVSLSRDNVKGVKANPRQITIFKGVKVEK